MMGEGNHDGVIFALAYDDAERESSQDHALEAGSARFPWDRHKRNDVLFDQIQRRLQRFLELSSDPSSPREHAAKSA